MTLALVAAITLVLLLQVQNENKSPTFTDGFIHKPNVLLSSNVSFSVFFLAFEVQIEYLTFEVSRGFV